jgi:hypothetical protein
VTPWRFVSVELNQDATYSVIFVSGHGVTLLAANGFIRVLDGLHGRGGNGFIVKYRVLDT